MSLNPQWISSGIYVKILLGPLGQIPTLLEANMSTIYAQLPGALLPWYKTAARDLPWRHDKVPYHIWISEIMLQQTRVEAVLGYYSRFLAALPDIPALATVEQDTLFKLWEGLGYYSRARNLQKAAQLICKEYGGIFPQDFDAIRALPGIGPYTAGAIASICFEMPTPAVDGNVLRVMARVCDDDSPIDLPATKESVTKELATVYPPGACGDFTQSLMELGATVCLPRNPKCLLCPASSFCQGLRAGRAAVLPCRLPKRAKRVEEKTVFLFSLDGKLALERRPNTGLLSGLWQLPNVEGTLLPQAALEAAETLGLQPQALVQELHRAHIFTHIRWDMTAYVIRCAGPAGYTWASRRELGTKYALPTAFRQFLEPAQAALWPDASGE